MLMRHDQLPVIGSASPTIRHTSKRLHLIMRGIQKVNVDHLIQIHTARKHINVAIAI